MTYCSWARITPTVHISIKVPPQVILSHSPWKNMNGYWNVFKGLNKASKIEKIRGETKELKQDYDNSPHLHGCYTWRHSSSWRSSRRWINQNKKDDKGMCDVSSDDTSIDLVSARMLLSEKPVERKKSPDEVQPLFCYFMFNSECSWKHYSSIWSAARM